MSERKKGWVSFASSSSIKEERRKEGSEDRGDKAGLEMTENKGTLAAARARLMTKQVQRWSGGEGE